MSNSVFGNVLTKLRIWRSELVQDFVDSEKRQTAIKLKTELDRAIACLELCDEHDVAADSKLVAIPNLSTMTASSEFRLIEDNETDDREQWVEVEVNGEFIRPLPGSLIIERTFRRKPQ